jgi:cyanophycin synthetase
LTQLHQPSEASKQIWQIVGAIRTFPGYGFGLRDPSVIAVLKGQTIAEQESLRLWDALTSLLPILANTEAPELEQPANWLATANWLLDVCHEIQRACKQCISSRGQVIGTSLAGATIAIPTRRRSAAAVKELLTALVQARLDDVTDRHITTATQAHLTRVVDRLLALKPKASNTARFYEATRQLDLPYLDLEQGVTQVGIASRSCWLSSSLTGATPAISTRLARNKMASLTFLRAAGLPVSTQEIASNAEHGVLIARKLGFPVVVKPNDCDGGDGVAAGLETEADVIKAFKAAKAFSDDILIEKHFHGKDYRLTVFQGRLLWAIERQPAGVDGDGSSTVEELIAAKNRDPNRSESPQAPLRPIIVDDEVRDVLKAIGKSLDWVPNFDQHVRLRRISNIATGGTPNAVLSQVHPDNASLAIRAAQVMGLDLAGIDLIIPDIGTPWHVSGAIICEINAQPTLGQTTAAHLYGQILQVLCPKGGRVPTLVILGARDGGQLANSVAQLLTDLGLTVGVQTQSGLLIGQEKIGQADLNAFSGAQTLALNRDVEAIVLSYDTTLSLQMGMGIDRIDVLVLTKDWSKDIQNAAGTSQSGIDARILDMVAPNCCGVILDLDGECFPNRSIASMTSAHWDIGPFTGQDISQRIIECLMQISTRRDRLL